MHLIIPSHFIVGLWPAIWTLGNLGRAGYGASLDGMVCRLLSSLYPDLFWL